MNFKDLSEKDKADIANYMFQPLNSAKELKDWIMMFLGLDMPIYSVDPDSNASPIDAMWEIYSCVKDNRGNETPGFIMLSARECYKCQAKGSKLLTPNGLKNIEDANIGDIVWTGFSWQKITNHIYDGFKHGITVEVDGGLKFTGSPIHRYWTLRDGKEQWIRSDELNEETDLIAINTNTGLSNQKVSNLEAYETGYFLGILAGDGTVSSIDSTTHAHFGFTTIDPYLKEIFYNYIAKKWGSKISIGSDGITYCVWDKNAIKGLKDLGVKPQRSWEKTVPDFCYTDPDAIKGFIAGLLDTDGSFSKQGNIILSITSLKLLQDVQKALVGFGVLSRVRSNVKLYCNQKHMVHSLTVAHSEINNLTKSGINISAKKANKAGLGKIPNTHDSLPKKQIQWFIDLCNSYGYVQIRNRKYIKRWLGNYPSVSVAKITHLCNWMEENAAHGYVNKEDMDLVQKMRSILKNKWRTFKLKKEDSVEFYDLTVENDHSYWSNGSISHNTLGASILETILMLHFEVTIAHMAAIQSQSAKAIQYINYFFGKIEPLLTAAGWVNTSQNKNKIEYRTPDGEDVYIRVIIATLSGANSEHTTLMFVDEIDVVKDPLAYEEAKLIPGYTKGIYPVTIKLSTRKFAFGLMQREIDLAPISGDKILRWNIIDVTERCPTSRHKPELPKIDAYVAKNLPLKTLTVEDYNDLPDVEKSKYEHLQQVHGGCMGCKLLPVCKTRLSRRDENATGGLYKPIDVVINNFKKTNPDMGEAQLMCWKPSSKGLVYPRFESTINTGNVMTLEKAYQTLVGEERKKVSELDLLLLMKTLGIRFFAGVDWGYTHDFVIVIFALIPNGEVWIIDSFGAPGLEFSDIIDVAKQYRDKYHPEKWFCDQAMPSHIKSFNKNGMRSPAFTKDVMGGIESLRSKIVDGSGRRLLRVLYTDQNKKIVEAFVKHHFKLDGGGNPTLVPDDTPGIADSADAMRYVGQNLFPVKGPQKPSAVFTEQQNAQSSNPTATEQLKQEIYNRVDSGPVKGGTGKKGGFFWNF